jgi:hypothetical protein
MKNHAAIVTGCFVGFIFANPLHAQTQTTLTFELGDGVQPHIHVPLVWSDQLYSSLGYTAFSSTQVEKLSADFGDSRSASSQEHKQASVRLLGYRKHHDPIGWVLGADYKNIAITKQEFGFFQLPSDQSYQTIVNEMDIEVNAIGLGVDADYVQDNYQIRLSGFATLASELSIQQETRVKPLVEQTGRTRENASQPFAYQLGLDIQYSGLRWFDLALGVQYDYLPLNYNTQSLGYVNDAFQFQSETIDSLRIATDIQLKIYLKNFKQYDLSPMIGYGVRKVSVETNNITTDSKDTYYLLGLERLF